MCHRLKESRKFKCDKAKTCLYFCFIYLRNDDDDAITVDIHFQQSTMVKYRTDVDFDWLDLMGSL